MSECGHCPAATHLPLEGGGRREAAGGGELEEQATLTPPRTYGPTLHLKGRVKPNPPTLTPQPG